MQLLVLSAVSTGTPGARAINRELSVIRPVRAKLDYVSIRHFTWGPLTQ